MNAGHRNLKRGPGPGRPKGVPNKATTEVKKLCTALVEDADYQARFRTRMLAGKLPPMVEAMAWYYAFGKPREQIQLDANVRMPTIINRLRGAADAGDEA
jgi:hypothetical protein